MQCIKVFGRFGGSPEGKTELLRWSVSGNVKWKNQSPRVFLSSPACVESVFQCIFLCVCECAWCVPKDEGNFLLAAISPGIWRANVCVCARLLACVRGLLNG